MDEAGDVINLIGTEGFSATVEDEHWPMIGGEVAVRRRNPPQSWSGNIESFALTTRFVAEWTLRSGKSRQLSAFGDLEVGHVFPVGGLYGQQWEATVTEAHPAGRVRVSYTIKSGARRARDFFVIEPVRAFFHPQPDGSVVLRVLP